jgi:hypothetical protein
MRAALQLHMTAPSSICRSFSFRCNQSCRANGDRWERAIARNIALDAPYR